MPIFVDRATRVICQGEIDEREIFHVHQTLLYGTQLVAWVKSGFGGREELKLPIFASVREAKRQTNATVCLISAKRYVAADAIIEAIEAQIELIVCLTDNIPYQDMVDVLQVLKRHPKSRLIGPGSCGVMTPLQCKVGLMPGYIFTPGPMGILSTTDTLGYEVVWRLTSKGFGQSTFVSLGSELLSGTSVVDVLKEFQADFQTELIFLVLQSGMVGFDAVVEWLVQQKHKPVYAAIGGASVSIPHVREEIGFFAVDGATMATRLRDAGVQVVENVSMIGQEVWKG